MEDFKLRNYETILTKCRELGRITFSVAVAQDEEVLRAVWAAQDEGLADAILVGDAEKIRAIAGRERADSLTIINEPDDTEAARKACSLVRDGKAGALMKGLINTSDFLKAVLAPESGLTTGSLLSHLAVFEVPGQPKLQFHTDGGINISPNLQEKKEILLNALKALTGIGVRDPKVAVLSANEKVNPKMPSTTDARALSDMRKSGQIPFGIVEGPIALDVAISPQAALHKGIRSEVSGDVDLFLVPNIESGNLLGKAMVYFANAKMAGLVLGAACPIVLTSRADTAEGKLHSIAMANLVARSLA